MFEPLQDRKSSRILKWTPSFTGLLAATWVAWIACPAPPEQLFTTDGLLRTATKYAALVSLTALSVGWFSATFIPSETKREASRLVRRMSLVALWLAPLMIFLSRGSMWAAPIMGLFVAGMTVLLRSDQAASRGNDDSGDPHDISGEEFPTYRLAPPQPGRRAAVVAIAAFAQSALVAFLIGVSLAASFFFGLSVAFLTWLLPYSLGKTSAPARRRVWSYARPVLGVASAMLLLVVGLIPYLGTVDGGEPSWLALLQSGEGPSDVAPQSDKKTRKRTRLDNPFDDVADPLSPSFPGVVLWPEAKPHVTLVPPQALTYGRLTLDRSKPFSVPFNGVYWFLRSESGPPPENAFVTRGSPVNRTFRTTARTVPLTMTARHNFGSTIDVSCCDRIQLEIRNADGYPNTVSLGLTLVNTLLSDKPSQYLGKALVRSMPRLTSNNQIVPARETLVFFIPKDTALKSFDEVAVSFGRDWRRRNQSVKVAIDRFVLIPPGRSSIPKRTLPTVGPSQRITD